MAIREHDYPKGNYGFATLRHAFKKIVEIPMLPDSVLYFFAKTLGKSLGNTLAKSLGSALGNSLAKWLGKSNAKSLANSLGN